MSGSLILRRVALPLNQLYHDHGVARTLAQHSVSASARIESAAEALRVGERIRSERVASVPVRALGLDKFEVFRASEVRLTSTQFGGGDWRWRLIDAANKTLVEGGGYRSKRACVLAVSLLRERANLAV